MKLYGHPLSGHAHRPLAFMKLLGLEFEDITVDLMAGEHKQPEFLKMNPLGQVPVFTDGDVTLRDSCAILTYLALKYDSERKWLPDDPLLAAEVQSWLVTSAKEVFDGPFKARLVKLIDAPLNYEEAVEKSKLVLGDLFEPHLTERDWLVGDQPTIADIANYSYIAVAPEGDIDLSPYPNVQAWLKRVEAIDGFYAMPAAKDIMGG